MFQKMFYGGIFFADARLRIVGNYGCIIECQRKFCTLCKGMVTLGKVWNILLEVQFTNSTNKLF